MCLNKVIRRNLNTDSYLIRGWSKRYRRTVSLDEIHEINANLSSFLDIMEHIDLYLQEKNKENPLSRKDLTYNNADKQTAARFQIFGG